ncbi:MAG: hypothetical protein D5R97_06640 [Candidatus Syntrophonatronum acetioxidans]|uniref:Uncharacterized protein n=1 Tax=Candidatus Syntrophonatronum acetioxidans TaxID=1795816 RepID=A0A424YCV9_9FIRM|nr:MAG: hypothetical protein D5R97_06640 [Candidatus Syntrophonatronum acetioxidans]
MLTLIQTPGAVETIEEALQRQRKLLYGELMGKKGVKGWLFRLLKIDQKGEKQALRVMEKIRRTHKDVARIQLVKMNAKWLREHLACNVRKDLPKITCPILAGGEVTWEIIENIPRCKTINGTFRKLLYCYQGHSCEIVNLVK